MTNAESNVAGIIKSIAREEGMELLSLSSDWAFRLSKDGMSRYIVGYQFPLNRASAKEICQDKVLTCEVMQAAGIPVVEYTFLPDTELKTYTGSPDSFAVAKELLKKYKKAVIKDDYGTGGNQVYLVKTETDVDFALREIFKSSSAAAVSPYYDILEEYRAVMLYGEVRLMIRKERASVVGDGICTVKDLAYQDPEKMGLLRYAPADILTKVPKNGEKVYLNWKHNLGQGAHGIVVTDPEVIRAVSEIAKRAAEEAGVRFASVDIISTDTGLRVLEINGGVMMEHFSGQSEENYETAKSIYRDAILRSFKEA